MNLEPSDQKSSFRSGLLFGLGFSLPFIFLFWIGVGAVSVVMRHYESTPTPAPERPRFGPKAGLEIREQRALRGASSLYVVGQVANKGSESWESVRIEVRLLDTGKNVLGMCETALFATLYPGKQAYFQVNCDHWDKDAFPKYDTYIVEIVDARPEFRIGA